MTRFGDPIPGSNLYRAFCCICGEAMRVPKDSLYETVDGFSRKQNHYCECSWKPVASGTGLVPRQKIGKMRTGS